MANFTVTTLTDIVDAGDGETSLREALVLANSDPNTADTITFSTGGALTLTQGELAIAGDVTIDGDVNGDGKADITIDGNHASRVIKITAGDVGLHSLVVTGGQVTTGGGGVFVAAGASADIVDSTITGNATSGSSDARGGGIRNEGTTTLMNSTVSNNSGSNAGGIFNIGGTLSVINTTVSGNSGLYGGGIYSNSGRLDITSSTVSGNFGGSGFGAGVNSLNDQGTLSNSIVAGNFGRGGVTDVSVFGFTHTLAFAGVNVLSQAGGGGANDIHEADLGNIFAAVTTVDPDGTPGNGNEFQAGVLADNGGPVQTIAINPVGVAFNAADAGTMPADSGDLDHDANTTEPLPIDARGAPRVFDGAPDVGAFEVQGGRTLVVTTLNDEIDSTNPNATLADFGGAGDLSLREAPVLAQRDTQDTITFGASLAGHTLTLTQGELAIAGILTIDGDVNGDGKADITIDGNHASRVIKITAGDVGLHSLVLTGGQVTTGGGGVFVAAGASADIVDTTITGNATSGSSDARGGGIRNEGTTTLMNSTVSNNSGSNAGGIFNIGGTLSVINTTVSGNSGLYGGGIYSNSGRLDITSSTVSGNFGGSGFGAGVNSLNDQGTVSNSIVAGNFGRGGVTDVSVFGFTHTLAFAGVNVLSQAGGGGANDIHEADLGNIFAAVTTVDPDGTPGNGNEFQAGVLADNGGPVQTIAIKAGGVAQNAGDAASAVFDHDGDPLTADQPIPTDARGFVRDVAGLDIGALEIQSGTAFVVTTLADEVFDGGDLAAETADGGGLSLREALALANANPNSADSIAFSSSLAGGSSAGMNDGHLTLTNGELIMSGDVTINGDIDGNGSPDITIDAAGNSRVLAVTAGTSTLEGLVITGGNGGYGAGIVTDASVDLTIINSAITNNHGGGGIRNVGTLTLDGVTVSGNSSDSDAGGIANALSTAKLSIIDSTIANNTATFNGGGLVVNGGTTATLTNVTMSGNEANGSYGGGAIFSGGDLTLSQVTITGNHADANGGALYIGAGSVSISNSIIAGNAADGVDDDVFVPGAASPIGYAGLNVVGVGTDTDGSDHVIEAPSLGALFANVGANAATGVVSGVLADNGGPVQTVAIKTGSVAHNAGDAASAVYDHDGNPATADQPIPTDARGQARDVAGVDIGALELQAAANFIVTTLADEVFDGGDLAAEMADGGGLSLREALALANADVTTADSIVFSASLAGGSSAGVNDGHLTLTNGELVISGDVTVNGDIDGNGSPDITIDAAGNSRVLAVTAGTSTLEGLVITGGNGGYGAGIVTDASVDLTIINSAITNNHVGGGIRNVGTMTLDGVTVSGNSSVSDAGGIANALSTAKLSIIDSTIANNTATFNGGGLVVNGGTTATLTNVTMSGNEANGSYGGGAIFSGGDLTLSQVTITGNHADANGGALYIGAGSVSISNSIIAGNAADGVDDDVFVPGAANQIGYAGLNVVGIGTDTDASDHVVQAPTLQDLFANVGANAATGVVSGVLANNGGRVQTVALAASALNPALDASSSSVPATDARGIVRDDLSLVANANGTPADLGAYELQDELTITGTVAGQAITDQQTLAPFTAVTVASPDLPTQIVTVNVTLDQPGKGAFTPASLTASGFTLNGSVAGQYDFTGTAAAATTAIHQLIFAPVANTHATMAFSIAVSDGLVSASDTQTTVVITDVTLPAAPTIALANDSGVLGADHITNDPTIAYGAVETGATLFYKADGAANFSTTAPTFAIDGSADGAHTVSVQQRDAAGNMGAIATLTFTLDTTAPAAPGIALAHDTGSSATDHITNNAAIVYGTAENGATLLYKADGAANFSTVAPTFASDGAHTVTVAQRDAAGNVSASSTLNFTLDTAAPQLTGLAASPASGNKYAGSTIDFTLAFNEAVGITGGSPALTLNTGRTAGYDAADTAALHDAHKLAFDYLVSSSDPKTPALAVTGLVAQGASVQDIAGNMADLTGVHATFNGLSVNDPAGTFIPAYTINGITRPALLIDPSGHIILDNAGAEFMAAYGTKLLYIGVPVSTPFPPVADPHLDFQLI